MDGNARWATERGLSVLDGHREGATTLKQTVRDAVSLGLLELTVYAFSTENWTRPSWEVEGLMAMFAELIESETPELDEQGVRMRFIGRRDEVSEDLRGRMGWAEEKTEGELGSDDEHRAETELQKLTDQHTAAIDAALVAKEKEILEV